MWGGVRWAVMKLSCGGSERGGIGRWVVVSADSALLDCQLGVVYLLM